MTLSVEITSAGLTDLATDILVVFAAQDAIASASWFSACDLRLGGMLTEMVASGEITGGAAETVVLRTGGKLPATRLILTGLGTGTDPEFLRRSAGMAARAVARCGLQRAAFAMPDLALAPTLVAQALVEGANSAVYSFDRYRSAQARRPGSETLVLAVTADIGPAAAEGARRGIATAEAVTFARDLCFTPPNDMGPDEVARAARSLAADPRITVEVLEGSALERLGMGALRAVGEGSHRPPKFIIVRFRPGTPGVGRPVVLIGKTVTFDSGGLSLKPALDMDRMKADMAGGAAVLAAVRAAAALDLPVDLVALLPVVENMPGGGAMRPGDVVRTMSGRTVEVLNTDAEGRLILADALHYADRLQPACVIDIATLTGASAIVFGPVGIGFFGNDDGLADDLLHADETAGERLWRLPLWPEHAALLTSTVADLANISTTVQQGSMLTAANFLAHFVGRWPWAHLDVYNTSWNAAEHPTLPKGPTASGTRTLVQFLIERAEGAGA